MTLTEATKTCFQKYVTFSGRAVRSEFWKFVLFMLLAHIVLLIVNSAIFGPQIEQGIKTTIDSAGNQTSQPYIRHSYTGGLFGTVFTLVTLLPWLAVTSRRMHDIGKSAWLAYYPWLLLFVAVFTMIVSTVGLSRAIGAFTGQGPVNVTTGSFFPFGFFVLLVFAGFIHVIVWLARASQPNENRFGPNPLHRTNPNEVSS